MRIILAALFGAFLLWSCGPKAPETAAEKQVIATAEAPAAIGPYSQAVRVGNTLYCSGQIAIDPATGELVTSDIEAETRRVLDNLGAVLHAADMDYRDVVRATV